MRKTLSKYKTIYLSQLQIAINYRLEMMLWSVIGAMPLLGIVILWLNAFSNQSEIAGFSQSSIISYYVIGYLFSELTGAHFEEGIIEQIRKGTIVKWLIKPFSLKRYLVTEETAWRTMTLVTVVIPVSLITLLIAPNILLSVKLKQLLVLPIFLLLAYLIESTLSLIIVAMGFIFEQARSLEHLKWMLSWIFSGSMIPPTFMPNWLAKWVSILPFQYRFLIPVQIFSNNIVGFELLIHLIKALIWLGILVIFTKWLWKRNIKSFTAVGS